jgi:N-methylhydantoinase A
VSVGRRSIRVGVDVGGTFTKAVAVGMSPVELLTSAVVPTSHSADEGVAAGVASALRKLFSALGEARSDVELVAYSTTAAMNALLEGDVARVGVVGIGAAPDLRRARRRTRAGDLSLAPGRLLHTEHTFIDATRGIDRETVDRALDELVAEGCEAIAVNGAFSVDSPEQEEMVAEAARDMGLPVCAGHELTSIYGLETRTVSSAINAGILPVVRRTAEVVASVLEEAGIDVPLLVLRGDGGAMALDAFKRAPSMTIGSGPAAGVAAALHQLALADGIVVECGGTSSNVSVVKAGRTVLRDLRVMGRQTALRSVDSWVVGAAGGSMPRLGRRRLEDVGPRSAHIAGLPYACFADPAELEEAQLELIAPRQGDPQAYAVLSAPDARRWALTATCAANALGLVDDAGQWSHGSSEAALIGFAELGARLRRSAEQAARDVLDVAAGKIATAVSEAGRVHDLGPDVPVVALGGAGGALVPEVARRLGRPLLAPAHPEVLSSVGAALSLVRAEVTRHGSSVDAGAIVREAERACVDAGAAPLTVRVQTRYEPKTDVVRAVATGAVALESGAAGRPPLAEHDQRRVAATAMGADEGKVHLVTTTPFYRVFSDNGGGHVAVVDETGAVPIADRVRQVLIVDAAQKLPEELSAAVEANTLSLGIAAVLPRVCVVAGAHVVDLSDHRRPEDIIASASAAVAGESGPAVAVVLG